MSETQVLVTVPDLSEVFYRNHFLEGGFTFQWEGLFFSWRGGGAGGGELENVNYIHLTIIYKMMVLHLKAIHLLEAHVSLDGKMENIVTRLEYNRYNFDFDSCYRDINLYFIFDKENDELIGSNSNYHLLANNKFQRYGKPVPVAKSFSFYYYMV